MKATRSKKGAHRSEAKSKGRVAEQIAAWLHHEPGVRVETNVRLPSLRQNRRREIDVLLTISAAGYPIRIAIECKNKGVVGSPEIDAFVGKLQDVGIPPQLGIFVSVGGFTSGAVDRARDASLRTFVLDGLAPDGLEAQLIDALESTVYLVATLGSLTIENDLPAASLPWQVAVFWDANGNVCGNVPLLFWYEWINGRIPDSIGTHQVELQVPEGWQQVIDGRRVTTRRILVEVIVRGLVLTLRGQAAQFTLRPPAGPGESKLGVRFRFSDPRDPQPLRCFISEEELDRVVRGSSSAHVTYRMKAPRIVFGSVYWPPTQTSLDRYNELVASGANPPSLIDVEGPSIGAAFAWPPRKDSERS